MTLTDTITDQLIHEFSKTIEIFDLSSSDARLFTIIYLNHQAMTLDEMSQVTGKSKTSVNTGIRNLIELNLVKQIWKKGIRKNLYTADEELFQRFMQTYLNKWLSHIKLQKQTISDIQNQAEKRDQGELISERIPKIIEFHSLIEDSFQKLQAQINKIV